MTQTEKKTIRLSDEEIELLNKVKEAYKGCKNNFALVQATPLSDIQTDNNGVDYFIAKDGNRYNLPNFAL